MSRLVTGDLGVRGLLGAFRSADELRERLGQLGSFDLTVGADVQLLKEPLVDLLRTTRNDAGHPTGRAVDEDTAYTHLQMAARYLEKMIALREHFDGQQPDDRIEQVEGT